MNEVGLVGKVTIVSKKDDNLKYIHNYLHIYLLENRISIKVLTQCFWSIKIEVIKVVQINDGERIWNNLKGIYSNY